MSSSSSSLSLPIPSSSIHETDGHHRVVDEQSACPTCLYVSNVDPHMSEADFCKMFSVCGEIVVCHLNPRPVQKRTAFIQFRTGQQAMHACSELNGRFGLKVVHAYVSTMFHRIYSCSKFCPTISRQEIEEQEQRKRDYYERISKNNNHNKNAFVENEEKRQREKEKHLRQRCMEKTNKQDQLDNQKNNYHNHQPSYSERCRKMGLYKPYNTEPYAPYVPECVTEYVNRPLERSSSSAYDRFENDKRQEAMTTPDFYSYCNETSRYNNYYMHQSSASRGRDAPIRSEIGCSESRFASRCFSNISETVPLSSACDRKRNFRSPSISPRREQNSRMTKPNGLSERGRRQRRYNDRYDDDDDDVNENRRRREDYSFPPTKRQRRSSSPVFRNHHSTTSGQKNNKVNASAGNGRALLVPDDYDTEQQQHNNDNDDDKEIHVQLLAKREHTIVHDLQASRMMHRPTDQGSDIHVVGNKPEITTTTTTNTTSIGSEMVTRGWEPMVSFVPLVQTNNDLNDHVKEDGELIPDGSLAPQLPLKTMDDDEEEEEDPRSDAQTMIVPDTPVLAASTVQNIRLEQQEDGFLNDVYVFLHCLRFVFITHLLLKI